MQYYMYNSNMFPMSRDMSHDVHLTEVMSYSMGLDDRQQRE